eukprot:scaffold3400_cov169-Amphora_coffeaeformis.AAC.4
MGDTIDQYEYAIASLLVLGKIRQSDLEPIMDKFYAVCHPTDGKIHVVSETNVDESNTVKHKLREREKSRRIDDLVKEAQKDEECGEDDNNDDDADGSSIR